MTSRLGRHIRDLELMSSASTQARRRIITQASDDLILALVDAAKMVIKGKVALSPNQLRAVRRHKQDFQKVIKPRTSIRQLKKVYQVGGFVPALLGPLLKIGLPIISGVLGGLGGGSRR